VYELYLPAAGVGNGNGRDVLVILVEVVYYHLFHHIGRLYP